MNKNNPYGYKIGYRENGSRIFIRYFMTYTYPQARMCLRHYRKAPPRERETNRPLINPFWEIKPITKKEILAGIWDEIPFPRHQTFFAFLAGAFLHIRRKIVHAHREIKCRLKFSEEKNINEIFSSFFIQIHVA